MSGDNKYTPGVETTKPKRSLVIILSILLGFVSILALVFLGTTLYYLFKYKVGCSNNLDGKENYALDSKGTKNASVARVKDVRLPYTVIPLYYDLRLQANIDGADVKKFNFTGSVRVRLLCHEATDFFFVHAHNELNVNQSLIRLVSENGRDNLIKQMDYDKARQWFKITATETLQPTKIYYLSFSEFGAPLTISLRGWYLSTYEEKNVTKYMATSQLQPTEARRVFPCWDEPAFKAVFEIKLVRRENFHSLSNMPLVRSRYLGDGWVEDSFKPTLNTSTYLLAFVVSQVTSISGLDAKGRNFTVWARPDLITAAKFALDLGKTIINFFEDYFELAYPLEKTDMLAVPHFAAGAMENWGLLIFREATLIWDPISGIENAKQKVASVISHEIAHQWFGNLVTLDWWDDLWLNEGFATFVECIGVAHAKPSWNMDEAFAVQHVQKVLYVDSMSTTRPVFLPVSHPDEINESFDTISYSKGAAVLRMMEAFITPEIFRQGLKIYLSKHKFRNTKPSDLWSAIEEANKVSNSYIDVEAVMNNWIKQAGYPIVTVKRLGGNQFELTQQRFVVSSGQNDSDLKFNKTVWNIPLTYATKSENMTEAEKRIIWMNDENLRLPINVGEGEWYAINLRQTGFYRVNYDMENWKILTETLIRNHQEIPRLMRAQLIDDNFRISNQGSLPIEAFLNLTRYLRNEREHVPLYVMARSFDVLNYLLIMHKSQPLLKAYVRSLISDAYADVDWSNTQNEDNHLYNLARQTIITMACLNGHKECISKSRSLFEDFMRDPTNHRIPSSLTPTVFCTVLRYGGATEFDYLKKMMVEALHEEEKHRIIEAMGCTQDFGLFKSFIFGLMDDTNQKYDELELPTTLNGNPVGLYALYDILKREFPNRRESFNFTLILRSIEKRGIYIDMLPIREELMHMNLTLSRESDKTAERAINRILRQSNRHQMWLSRNANTIHKWLKQELGDQNVPSKPTFSQSIPLRSTTGAEITA